MYVPLVEGAAGMATVIAEVGGEMGGAQASSSHVRNGAVCEGQYDGSGGEKEACIVGGA